MNPGIGGGVWSNQQSTDGGRSSSDVFLKVKSKTKWPGTEGENDDKQKGSGPDLTSSVKLEAKFEEIIPDTGFNLSHLYVMIFSISKVFSFFSLSFDYCLYCYLFCF